MSKFSTYQLSDGGLYIGELNDNGLPHSSLATCTWPNGTAYRGSWINGTMCGVGTMYENGAIKYRGYWWKGELIHIFGTEEPPRPETKLPKNKNKIAEYIRNQLKMDEEMTQLSINFAEDPFTGS